MKAEKTVDEIFSEADVFFKYGLLSKARELLEALTLRVPDNIDLHLRLKSVYSDIGDKESAVTECLILSELYRRGGENENSQKMLMKYPLLTQDCRKRRGLIYSKQPLSHPQPLKN
jgi:hypothetical protein